MKYLYEYRPGQYECRPWVGREDLPALRDEIDALLAPPFVVGVSWVGIDPILYQMLWVLSQCYCTAFVDKNGNLEVCSSTHGYSPYQLTPHHHHLDRLVRRASEGWYGAARG